MATITSPRGHSPNPARITSPSLPSAGGTPTSSVRPSLDLPPGSSPSIGGLGGPPTQRRNRAALRDYYNLKNKPPTSASELQRTASHRSNASDSTLASTSTLAAAAGGSGSEHGGSILPPQLDDPTFDADKYITELLKTSTLRDILRAESTLVSEIRNLDGERKALVYDNYSKLIKAVSTIGEMQKGMKDQGDQHSAGISGVKGLEPKLEGLLGLVQQMRDEGSGETAEQKNRVRESRARRRQQDFVRTVMETPSRLQLMVERGEADEADKEWHRVRAILDKWGSVKGVAEVRTACESIMTESEPDGTGSEAG